MLAFSNGAGRSPFRASLAELPYELEIKLVSSKELRDGSLRIEFDIVAPTMGSKKIVVGTQGAAIGVVGRCVDKASAPVVGVQGAPAARPRSCHSVHAVPGRCRTARLELERMWKRRVHLLLNVKTAGGS